MRKFVSGTKLTVPPDIRKNYVVDTDDFISRVLVNSFHT